MSFIDYQAPFEKQPDEEKLLGWNFAKDLGSTETITSATITIVDTSDDSDVSGTMLDGSAMIGTVTKVSGGAWDFLEDANGSTIVQKVKAGTDGSEYKLTIKANTDASLVHEADIIISVIEL